MTDRQPSRPRQRQIRLEVPASVNTTYANVVMIAHTSGEFVFDFVHLMPGIPMARVQSRVVMNPTSAKALYRALGENLEKYEKQFGEIKLPPTLADQLFSMVKPGEGLDDDDEDASDEQT